MFAMYKKNKIILLFFSLIITLTMGQMTVYGADYNWNSKNALEEYPNFNIKKVDFKTKQIEGDANGYIPKEYGLMFRYNKNIKYKHTPADGKTVILSGDKSTLRFNREDIMKNPKKERYVTYENIADYDSQPVDLRIDIIGITPGKSNDSLDGNVAIYMQTDFDQDGSTTQSDNFLKLGQVDVKNAANSTVNVRYTFLNHQTGEKIPNVKGMWNYKRINNIKGITLPANDPNFSQFYLYDSKTLSNKYKHYYMTSPTNSKDIIAFGESKMSNSEGPETEFTMLFNAEKGTIDQTFVSNTSGVMYINYSSEPMARFQFPEPQVKQEYNETKNSITFSAYQDFPKQISKEFNPDKFNLYMDFGEGVSKKNTDYGASEFDDQMKRIKGDYVIRTMGTSREPDRSAYYRAMLTPNALNDSNFYGHRYQFRTSTKLIFDDNTNLKAEYLSYKDKDDVIQSGYYFKIPVRTWYVMTDKNNIESESKKTSGYSYSKTSISAIPSTTRTRIMVGEMTSDALKKIPVTSMFDKAEGAYPTDELVIDNVENKWYSSAGTASVKVTLRGSKSGVKEDYIVPLRVENPTKGNINFVDVTGKEIATPVEKLGLSENEYDFTDDIMEKEIKNYEFEKLATGSSPIKGKYPLPTSSFDVTAVYKLKKTEVTMKYLNNEQGKEEEIFPIKQEQKEVATEYTFKPEVIPGYEVETVRVNQAEKQPVTADGIKLKPEENKKLSIIFEYKSVHFKLKLMSDSPATHGEYHKYQLDMTSGMIYPKGVNIPNYNDLKITIPLDDKLLSPKKIVIKENNIEVGSGSYDKDKRVISAKLDKEVKNTLNLSMSFEALVDENADIKKPIKMEATTSAVYEANGKKKIEKLSNKLSIELVGRVSLKSAPKMIDFGKITYRANKNRIENPNYEEDLIVRDSRDQLTSVWEVFASVVTPLTNEKGDKLDRALRYKNGEDEDIMTNENISIYTGGNQNVETNITKEWGQSSNSKGLKLQLDSSDETPTGDYIGKIRWTLSAGMP